MPTGSTQNRHEKLAPSSLILAVPRQRLGIIIRHTIGVYQCEETATPVLGRQGEASDCGADAGAGRSVSLVARRYGANVNMVFKWLRDPWFKTVEDELPSFLPVALFASFAVGIDAGKPSVGAGERGARGPPWRHRQAQFCSATHQYDLQQQRGPSRTS